MTAKQTEKPITNHFLYVTWQLIINVLKNAFYASFLFAIYESEQTNEILKGDLFHRPDLHRLQCSDTGTQNYQHMASIIPHVDMVVKHMDLYSEMLIKRDV